MGSLVCAVASYLDARKNGGRWLLRIEDIDPPREQAGARVEIQRSLETHGLHWDAPVVLQSERSHAYQQALAELSSAELSYRCNCNRARIKALGGVYDKHCATRPPPEDTPCAVRLDTDRASATHAFPLELSFKDGILGEQQQCLLSQGDFVIHRKDGLFAYQLAVVVDDIYQRVTDVVRGADLLGMTAQQCLLFRCLGHSAPNFSHHRLVTDSSGNKLSKQNHARAIDNEAPQKNLIQAFQLLSLGDQQALKVLQGARVDELLNWGLQQWQKEKQPSYSAMVQVE